MRGTVGGRVTQRSRTWSVHFEELLSTFGLFVL